MAATASEGLDDHASLETALGLGNGGAHFETVNGEKICPGAMNLIVVGPTGSTPDK